MDVMFYEVFAEEQQVLKRYLSRHIQVSFSKDRLCADTVGKPPAEFISIRTQSVIPSLWIKHLSGILTRSSGFDHLSVLRNQVPCGYLPAYCSRSVAEHAFVMVLMLAKKFKKQLRHFKAFDRDQLTGTECINRNLLVIGVGRVGKEVVSLGKAMGMRVRGIDLVKRLDALEYVTLEEGVSYADFIVCALPLTSQTKGLLNYDLLSRVKSGALFVNISRGEISPVKDLKRLLDEGTLGGLGMDVYEDEGALAGSLQSNEPLSKSAQDIMRLRDYDQVLFTPHNAFNTQDSLDQKAKQSVEAAATFLKNREFPFPVPKD